MHRLGCNVTQVSLRLPCHEEKQNLAKITLVWGIPSKAYSLPPTYTFIHVYVRISITVPIFMLPQQYLNHQVSAILTLFPGNLLICNL